MYNNSKPIITRNISDIKFEEYDLDNGLHVILHEDKTNPIVTIDLWYHVGSKNEARGKTGFAHLFEHMMFQGSENVKRTEHFKYIQKAGGYLNGSTSQDRTNYYESLPSNQLELALWLESDRMGSLDVNQENFDNQRDVVIEEKNQRNDNVPYGTKWSNLFKYSFKNEPYEWVPIGSIEDLNNATLEDAKKFYAKYYSPSNAVVTISGDISCDSALEKVHKYFGSIKSNIKFKDNFGEIKFNTGEVKEKVYDAVKIPGVFIAFKIPGLTENETPALELLTSILGSSRSSRLYSNVVYDRKLSKSANSFMWDNELGGLLIISCLGFVNSNPDEIEKGVTETIENLMIKPVTDFEIEKSKNYLETLITDSLQTNLGKAENLSYYRTYFKDTGLINTNYEKYSKITAEEIMRTATKYLVNDNRVVLHYISKNGN